MQHPRREHGAEDRAHDADAKRERETLDGARSKLKQDQAGEKGRSIRVQNGRQRAAIACVKRGTVVLPNGLGKEVKVLVFAKGEKEKEAQEAGAEKSAATTAAAG